MHQNPSALAAILASSVFLFTAVPGVPQSVQPVQAKDAPKAKEIVKSIVKDRLTRQVELSEAEGSIGEAAFSPDGKQIVTTGTEAGFLLLWDTAGRLIRRLDNTGQIGGGSSPSFHPDGQQVATASSPGVTRWDLNTGKRIASFLVNRVTVVAFSPSGKQIFAGSDDGTAELFDPSKRFPPPGIKLGATDRPVFAAVYSADGKELLTSIGRRVQLWDTSNGQELLRGFNVGFTAYKLAMSRDGKRILAAGWEGNDPQKPRTALFDGGSGKPLQTFKGARVASLSPDGKRVVTVHNDGIILWDADTGKELHQLAHGPIFLFSAPVFSPEGKQVLCCLGRQGARLWDVASGKEVCSLRRQAAPMYELAVAADGKFLVTGSSDGKARAWDLMNGRLMSSFDVHSIQTLSIAQGGKYAIARLAGTGPEKSILWETASGKQIRVFDNVRPAPVFLAGGRELIFFQGDRFCFHDCATGKELRTEKYNGKGWPIGIFADGKWMLVEDGGKRSLREFEPGKGGGQSPLFDYLPRMVAVSRDGKRAFAVGAGGMVAGQLWDLSDGKKLREFPGPNFGTVAAAMSPDGQKVLVGQSGPKKNMMGWDHVLLLYDANTGEVGQTMRGHKCRVPDLAFVPDREIAVGTCEDGSLRVWDLKDGKELCQVFGFADGTWAVIDPQGRFDGPDQGNVHWIYYHAGGEIVSLKQMHAHYYEPGLLARCLLRQPRRNVKDYREVGLHPSVAAKVADGKLRLELTNRGGGIGKVQVFVNDKQLVADARDARFDSNAPQSSLTVNLPAATAGRVRVVVWNGEGILSSAGLELNLK